MIVWMGFEGMFDTTFKKLNFVFEIKKFLNLNNFLKVLCLVRRVFRESLKKQKSCQMGSKLM